MIRMFLLIAVLILSFTFIIKNIDQMVVVDYFLGITIPPIPLYQLVGGALIFGMLLAGFLILPEWIRLRLDLRRQKKTLQRLEEELAHLRPPDADSETRRPDEPTEDEAYDETARDR